MTHRCNYKDCDKTPEKTPDPDYVFVQCADHRVRYQQVVASQLADWADGKPWHNEEFDECCPDFSCCGHTISPVDVRARFKQATDEGDEATVSEMLMMFLGGALPGDGVHIAGQQKGLDG